MKWTKTKPTEPAMYWYEGPTDFRPKKYHTWRRTIAELGIAGRVRFIGKVTAHSLDQLPDSAQWAGPIEEPTP